MCLPQISRTLIPGRLPVVSLRSFRPIATVYNRSYLHAHALHSQSRTPLSLRHRMTNSIGNFDLIKRINLGFANVQVTKWRSRKTGLSVVHLDYEGMLIIALKMASGMSL